MHFYAYPLLYSTMSLPRPEIIAVKPPADADCSKRTNISQLVTPVNCPCRCRRRLVTLISKLTEAVIMNFSLNPNSSGGSQLAKAYHMPIGILFSWSFTTLVTIVVASLLALSVGLGNYFKTIRGYSERRAVVQVGFKTQSIAIVLGGFIIAVALLFIATNPTPI
jgi:hypothetical protein